MYAEWEREREREWKMDREGGGGGYGSGGPLDRVHLDEDLLPDREVTVLDDAVYDTVGCLAIVLGTRSRSMSSLNHLMVYLASRYCGVVAVVLVAWQAIALSSAARAGLAFGSLCIAFNCVTYSNRSAVNARSLRPSAESPSIFMRLVTLLRLRLESPIVYINMTSTKS
jgi:hypothetical protein